MNEISIKLKKVLKIILIIFFIILIKLWHLTIIKFDEKKIEALRPQRKTVINHFCRGGIYDRFDHPIAINKIKYNACIYYAHIRKIPSIKWLKNENGKKIKTYPRKEHIKKLAKLLCTLFHLDFEKTEDIIHSKASLLPHVPFIIKENISEKKFYKLKILEKDYLGLNAEITSERYYPNQKDASTILGYMGAISFEKYRSYAREIKKLENMIENEMYFYKDDYVDKEKIEEKLQKIKEKAYSVNDLIGKTGLEYAFEHKLRGIHGKKTYEIDTNGNFLKELPSSKPKINGKKINSSISIELQQFAEKLLSRDEKHRDGKNTVYNPKKKIMEKQKQPFIKGGAIVVINPKNGQIYALASYPRFNPNDFIYSSNQKIKKIKQKNVFKWLEAKPHIANIWHGIDDISREVYDKKKGYVIEKEKLTLENYLKYIFPKDEIFLHIFNKLNNIKSAIEIQESAERLLYITQTKSLKEALNILFLSESKSIKNISKLNKNSIDWNEMRKLQDVFNFYFSGIKNIDNILLFIDICKLFIHSNSFSDDLIEKLKNKSVSNYFENTKALYQIEEKLKKIIKPLFYKKVFLRWKEKNGLNYLKQKRNEEKLQKKYAKPYIEYFDEIEKMLFDNFYKANKLIILTSIIKEENLSDEKLFPYISIAKEKINKKLYKQLHSIQNFAKKLSFNDTYFLLKTFRYFNDLDRPLYGKYYGMKKNSIEKDLAMQFYPKNGFQFINSTCFRRSTPLGSLFKIAVAYSALKKHYNKLAFNNQNSRYLNPFTMIDKVKWDSRAKKGGSIVVGYSEDNKPFPRYYKGGRLPKSAHKDIGKIDIIEAIAQSSNPYFSILAGDYITDPEDLLMDAKNFKIGEKTSIDLPGEIKGHLPNDLLSNKTGLYSFAIGQHTLVTTPLQTTIMLSAIANKGEVIKPQIIKKNKEVLHKIFLPNSVRNTILNGLKKTIWSHTGSARPELIKKLKYNKNLKDSYISLKNRFIGKTSTAEIMQKLDITTKKAEKYKDIWFGGIYFEDTHSFDNPMLVVVIYLRYGDGGKEAAPLAAEIIHKYEELKEKYSNNF